MRTETPVQIKLADYTPYPFAIDHVEMAFDLDPSATKVRTKMRVRRLSEGDLVLDGVALALNSISIDGVLLSADAYALTDETLTVKSVPIEFELETDVTIDPSANTALSGLYISGGRFCSQCESIGFRRITYWPDRPDVMSRFKVRIEARQKDYPVLLSNGTPGATGALTGGRHFAEWAFDGGHGKTAGIGKQIQHTLALGLFAHPVAPVTHVQEQPTVLFFTQVDQVAQVALGDGQFVDGVAHQPFGGALRQVAVLQGHGVRAESGPVDVQ